MLRPRGSKRGQDSAPATVQHTWPRRGSDPEAVESATSGGSPLHSCRHCLLSPLAPHSPAATGHGHGQGLWLADPQPQPRHGQAQGCHSHTQQGMESRGSLWPPALLWDGVKLSVLRRRGSNLIIDISREVGPWRVRLGNRLQEPGSEHCLSGSPGASEHRGRVGHRKTRTKVNTRALRCPLWWSSREVKWEL